MRGSAAAAAALLLAACTVGPDFKRPAPPEVSGYTAPQFPARTAAADVHGGEEQQFARDQQIPRDWWTLFHSTRLNSLVDRALKANPTVTAAQAALRQAWENVYAQQGFFYPTVQANYSPSRSRTSAALSPVPASGSNVYTLHTAQLTVSYAPDVFGGNRREVESLTAQANAQRFQVEATYLTLSSNVVAAAIQEASLREQISASHEIIDAVSKQLDILRKQRKEGYAAGLDVAAQESALASVQETLPPLQKQLEQTRDLIAALAGGFRSSEPEQDFGLADLQLPVELPVSLPSKLVQQRPDVRAAEEQLHSACAEIGVATANILPQFSITGAMGGTAGTFGQMFNDDNPFWALAGSITQTLFDGGTLLHRKRAADAAFEAAAASYKSTVISAFQNVSDALYALQTDAAGLKAAVAAEVAARKTLDITRRQQELGYVNYLALLGAQQAYQSALITRVQQQTGRFADTAALFQALGGGWWSSAEQAAK